MSRFVSRRQQARLPRLPLRGSLDLTYRCNNRCRHCWLRIPPDSAERERELSSDELLRIVEAARGMGCRQWSISGGEPMIRPDFADLFAAITDRAASYTLNTNGTLITPRIARLMKRK
jgi:MoaA/NifB/PqqE/SkfB family radical SAM enzyme